MWLILLWWNCSEEQTASWDMKQMQPHTTGIPTYRESTREWFGVSLNKSCAAYIEGSITHQISNKNLSMSRKEITNIPKNARTKQEGFPRHEIKRCTLLYSNRDDTVIKFSKPDFKFSRMLEIHGKLHIVNLTTSPPPQTFFLKSWIARELFTKTCFQIKCKKIASVTCQTAC